MKDIYPFTGVIQHYAWGGYDYLPSLLRENNAKQEPWAELWMGTHTKGSGKLNRSNDTLIDLISEHPREILGTENAIRFDDKLPFLFKVLDVRDMLSIQVHPDKKSAEAGFAREEAEGVARDASDRNYRDDNHKPELGVALTDFYLLHGFKQEETIRTTLKTVPGWSPLLPILEEKGVKGVYEYVMRADQTEIDGLLTPLVADLQDMTFTRDDPHFWAQRAVEQYSENDHHDRGMFSIFWFNLVHLRPGEGIFQDAGIPHAYLEGVCIELMANSDNVLRGGLTPKHIDVPELLKNTKFQAVVPNILEAKVTATEWKHYSTPAPDFHLWKATLTAGSTVTLPISDSVGLLLVLNGEIEAGTQVLSESQRTALIPASSNVKFTARRDSEIYLASPGTSRLT